MPHKSHSQTNHRQKGKCDALPLMVLTREHEDDNVRRSQSPTNAYSRSLLTNHKGPRIASHRVETEEESPGRLADDDKEIYYGSSHYQLGLPEGPSSLRDRSHSASSIPTMSARKKISLTNQSPPISGRLSPDPTRLQRKKLFNDDSRRYSCSQLLSGNAKESELKVCSSNSMSPENPRRRLPLTPDELKQQQQQQQGAANLLSPTLSDSPTQPRRRSRLLPETPSSVISDLSKTFRAESRTRQAQSEITSRCNSQTPPPVLCVTDTSPDSSDSVKTRRANHPNGYPPDAHRGPDRPAEHIGLCRRRSSEQTLDSYVETQCTCPGASGLTESVESKSSTDTEESSALALPVTPFRRNSAHPDSVNREKPAIGLDARARSASSNSAELAITAEVSARKVGEDRPPIGLGMLKFCVQYFPVRKRLRLSILKAEGLAGQLRPELELHTLVKLCLMPGKLQKQHSRIVKRSRDAVFNEEFFFDNVLAQDVGGKSVSIRVCHHAGKQFQKDVVIGEIDLPLAEVPNLHSKKEIRLQKVLKPKWNKKKLGRIQISTCLEPEARRLTINVIKADDLPKFGISGPPDPCIRITVDQLGKIQTKQTRILKATCHAAYREAVMFLVSTKPAYIDSTKITVAVVDTARTGLGTDVIGQAFLGQLAVDKSEIEQWKNTCASMGKEYKASHVLKPPSDNGDDDVLEI